MTPKAKKSKKACKVKVEETEANDDVEEELARRVAEEEQAYEAGKLERRGRIHGPADAARHCLWQASTLSGPT